MGCRQSRVLRRWRGAQSHRSFDATAHKLLRQAQSHQARPKEASSFSGSSGCNAEANLAKLICSMGQIDVVGAFVAIQSRHQGTNGCLLSLSEHQKLSYRGGGLESADRHPQ